MYPVKRVQIEREILRDDLEELPRADRLALRLFQLTDSLYSVLILRRLHLDYGITTTARYHNHCDTDDPGQDFATTSNRKSPASSTSTSKAPTSKSTSTSFTQQLHLDDSHLIQTLCEKDPYIEMANEAMLCANHIENGIALQSNPDVDPADRPGSQWHPRIPNVMDDFGTDYVEMYDTDTSRTKYSKSRNFLVENGLTGSDGNVGDIVYLKELLCSTLANVKNKQYGHYHQHLRHTGHFLDLASDTMANDAEQIPCLNVKEEKASFFGERKRCRFGRGCGHRIEQHATPREWYCHTEVNPYLSPTERRRQEETKTMGIALKTKTPFQCQMICSKCMEHEKIATTNPCYLQQGDSAIRAAKTAVSQMSRIMLSKIVRKSSSSKIDSTENEDLECQLRKEEIRKQQELNTEDGGLIFAVVRAKAGWKNLVQTVRFYICK
jgi:hypothetical protein